MKTILTTAAIIATLTFPVFAESEDPADKAGEAQGSLKASTDINQDDELGLTVLGPQASMIGPSGSDLRAQAQISGARAEASGGTKMKSGTKVKSGARAELSGTRAQAGSAEASGSEKSDEGKAFEGWLFKPATSGMDGGNRK